MSEQTTTTETDYITSDAPAAAPLALRREEIAPLAVREPEPEQRREQGPQMMSTRTETLFRALMRAQLEFGEVRKTRQVLSRNGAVMYRYANLSDLVDAVMPALKNHGFATTHIARGNRLYVRLVHVESEQWIEGVLPFVAPTVNGPEGVQALGSLLTYLRRYLLAMLLGVVAVDDDDDGNINARRAS